MPLRIRTTYPNDHPKKGEFTVKVSCFQQDLAKGLSIVGRAIAQRSTLPVLSNILLATDQGLLKLSATNLEMAVTCWIAAKVEKDGATTMPARTLVDLVGAMPAEVVTLDLNARTEMLSLDCGRFKSSLRGIAASEFPLVPIGEADGAIYVEADALKMAIKQVVYAAATEESRPILTGVLAIFEDEPNSEVQAKGKVTFAASDGFRLAVRTLPLAQPVGKRVSVIIPAKALAELGRIMGDQENVVKIVVKTNQVLFQLDDIQLMSQLIDGNFADYSQIIPKKKETRAVAGVAELLKACKSANVFARDSSNIITLTVTPGNNGTPGTIHLQAVSAETGDNKGNVDAVVEGVPIEIAFNSQYMMDALSAMGTAQVALETTTANSPGKLTPVGDDGLLCVVMPMNLTKR
jgi:DNA polymerase-3 subunit beta